MKPLKKLLTLAIATLTAFAAINADNIKPTVKIKVPPSTPTKGHGCPSRIFIECLYSAGCLTFLSAEEYGPMSVTVQYETTGEIWTETVDEYEPQMEISSQPGYYTIDIETVDGRMFSGGFSL